MNATASPFNGLGSRSPWQVAEEVEEAPEGDSKTARMRAKLRRDGPCTAAVLAAHVRLSTTGLVAGLLKWDIERGRVRFHRGVYEISEQEVEQHEALQEAIALVRRHGYKVTKS